MTYCEMKPQNFGGFVLSDKKKNSLGWRNKSYYLPEILRKRRKWMGQNSSHKRNKENTEKGDDRQTIVYELHTYV